MINLIEVLENNGIYIPIEQVKVHLAISFLKQDPYKLFIENKFKDWQEIQSKKNFPRRFVISLIRVDVNIKDMWIFAGVYKVNGYIKKSDGTYKYQTELLPKQEDILGKIWVKYKRTKQSYLNGETCLKSLIVIPGVTSIIEDEKLNSINHYLKDKEFKSPDEVQPNIFTEGGISRILVNSYERSPEARKVCIEKYGYKCSVCNFDFEEVYGDLGKEYIHVHHKIPVSLRKELYTLDPINDLIPVCPNCHAMLHRSQEILSVEQLRNIKEGQELLNINKDSIIELIKN